MIKDELSHKVYLTTFIEPNYKSKIGELIYGKKELTYPKLMGKKGVINKCLKRGLIEEHKDLKNDPDKLEPGYNKRKYYRAKKEPLIKRIEATLLLDLSDELEKYILGKILDSEAFRFLVKKHFIKNFKDYLKNISIDAYEIILSYLDILLIICRESRLFNEYSNEIWTIDNYNKYIEQKQKDKELMNKIDIVMKKLSEEETLLKEVRKDAIYLFALPDHLNKSTPVYDGLSEFGKNYYYVKAILGDFTKLLKL